MAKTRLLMGKHYLEWLEQGKKAEDLAVKYGVCTRTLQRAKAAYLKSLTAESAKSAKADKPQKPKVETKAKPVKAVKAAKPKTESKTQKVSKPVKSKPKAEKRNVNYRFMVLTTQVYVFRETDGKDVQTRVYQKDTNDYERVMGLINNDTPSDSDLWDFCFEDITEKKIFKTAEHIIDCIRYDEETDTVFIHDKPLPKNLNEYVSKRFRDLAQNDIGLRKFIEHLGNNPDERVFSTLWDFMQYNNIQIDEDGYVIAWKVVKKNWKDIHSGKFDNSVGKVCKMPREKVDSNPKNTCSTGLHVAAFGYLKSFSTDNHRIVKVKVDPANFVSIPVDYNGMKARVCEYEVIEEYKGSVHDEK